MRHLQNLVGGSGHLLRRAGDNTSPVPDFLRGKNNQETPTLHTSSADKRYGPEPGWQHGPRLVAATSFRRSPFPEFHSGMPGDQTRLLLNPAYTLLSIRKGGLQRMAAHGLTDEEIILLTAPFPRNTPSLPRLGQGSSINDETCEDVGDFQLELEADDCDPAPPREEWRNPPRLPWDNR